MDETAPIIDNISLGPNIELAGVKELEHGSMPVVKKIIGHGVKLLSEKSPKFQSIKITLKKIHAGEGHGLFEVHGKALINGSHVESTVTNRNVFFALSDVLKKIEHQIEV